MFPPSFASRRSPPFNKARRLGAKSYYTSPQTGFLLPSELGLYASTSPTVTSPSHLLPLGVLGRSFLSSRSAPEQGLVVRFNILTECDAARASKGLGGILLPAQSVSTILVTENRVMSRISQFPSTDIGPNANILVLDVGFIQGTFALHTGISSKPVFGAGPQLVDTSASNRPCWLAIPGEV